jgi:hypothetical protein
MINSIAYLQAAAHRAGFGSLRYIEGPKGMVWYRMYSRDGRTAQGSGRTHAEAEMALARELDRIATSCSKCADTGLDPSTATWVNSLRMYVHGKCSCAKGRLA